jgi:hypothetical protein
MISTVPRLAQSGRASRKLHLTGGFAKISLFTVASDAVKVTAEGTVDLRERPSIGPAR